GDAILGDADDHLLGASLLGEQAQRLVGRGAGLRRSPDGRCALSKGGGAALPPLLGRAILQRDALGRHAARGPLRRHGATRSVHRGPAELLPNGARSWLSCSASESSGWQRVLDGDDEAHARPHRINGSSGAPNPLYAEAGLGSARRPDRAGSSRRSFASASPRLSPSLTRSQRDTSTLLPCPRRTDAVRADVPTNRGCTPLAARPPGCLRSAPRLIRTADLLIRREKLFAVRPACMVLLPAQHGSSRAARHVGLPADHLTYPL